jgi:hypothetical protein
MIFMAASIWRHSAASSVSPLRAIVRLLGGLGDRREPVLLEHLPRDDVNLHLGHHVALPDSVTADSRQSGTRYAAACSKPFSRSPVPLAGAQISRAIRPSPFLTEEFAGPGCP